MTTITALPSAPSRASSPATFATDADAFAGALPTLVTQINVVAGEINANTTTASSAATTATAQAGIATTQASLATTNGAAQVTLATTQAGLATTNGAAQLALATIQAAAAAASALTAINAPGTSASSTTSDTIALGTTTITVQTGKSFVVGQFVVMASTASVTNYMVGQITEYTSGTGSLTIGVTGIGGSGTFSDWTVSLTSPPTAAKITYITTTGAVNTINNLVNTTSAPITLTLPASPLLGDAYAFRDSAGTFATNNLTLARNGKTIMGGATDLACNVSGANFLLWFNGTDWRIL